MGRGKLRMRRLLVGLTLVGLMLGTMAFKAEAAAPKVIPNKQDIQRLVQGLKVQPPAIAPPKLDPKNPNLPPMPYVQIPPALNPALAVLSPAEFVVCQGAYLGPLLGVVALTVLLDQLPTEKVRIQPSFLSPAFGPVSTACVLAPFPWYDQCKQDATIIKAIDAAKPKQDLPSVGPLPTVDPFANVPAPFASLVVEADAIQNIVSFYGLNRTPVPGDPAGALAKQLSCS